MDEKIVDHVRGEATSDVEKKPYVKPQLHSLCVVGGTTKATTSPIEASPGWGPS